MISFKKLFRGLVLELRLIYTYNYEQTCSLTVLNMGYKFDFPQLKEDGFWRLTYIISVKMKALKHDSILMMILAYCHSTYILSVMNMGLKITWAKLRNSCTCTPLTTYLY